MHLPVNHPIARGASFARVAGWMRPPCAEGLCRSEHVVRNCQLGCGPSCWWPREMGRSAYDWSADRQSSAHGRGSDQTT